jgi:signal transduction histidine kinase
MIWLRHILWPIGLTVTAALVILIGDNPATTYGGTVIGGRILEPAAAVALLLAAAVDSSALRGTLLSLLGVVWLIPEAAGWLGGPAEVRIAADAARAPLAITAVAVALIAVSHRRGCLSRSKSNWLNPTVITIAVVTTVALAARLFLLDPFLEVRCWQNCEPNPLALNGFDTLAQVLLICAAAVCGALAVAKFVRPGAHRLSAIPMLALASASLAMDGGLSTRPSPGSWFGTTLFTVAQAAAMAVAAVVVVERYRDWRFQGRLHDLADRLLTAPTPGDLLPALRTATEDPTLRIDYWVAGRDHFVDAEGVPVQSPVANSTPITRQGVLLGRLVHRRALASVRIESAFGAALRLSLENERLRASTLAELQELRSSRMRVVEHAADERRRLERNLHDGAQQRIVALALLTRMLTSRASGPEAAALARRADTLARAVLEELRRVARGIYPVVLTDSGLGGAVLDLAQTSRDVAIVLDPIPERRYSGRVESTAFVVISAALEDARQRRASALTVSVTESDGVLVVTAAEQAPVQRATAPTSVADQVAAIAGSLVVSEATDGTAWRAELPCAS